MTEFQHEGLYFDTTAVERVRKAAKRKPYKTALESLAALSPNNPVEVAVVGGLCHHFLADANAAQVAAGALVENGAGMNLAEMTYIETCETTIAIGHAFEMIRDILPDDARRGWLRVYHEQVEEIRNAPGDRTPLETIWRTALKIIGGIVLDRRDLFVLGTDDFKQIVSDGIHPEGYFPALVEKSNGGALERQISGAKALTLTAEAAHVQGFPLWDYEVRGISAKTVAIYAAAYYEYREQWPWDEPPNEEANKALYRENAAFLEMLNNQLRPVVLKSTLDLLRPLYDPLGGGATTLSHAQPASRGLFGFGG